MSQSGSDEVSLTEAGGGSLLLLYNMLVSNRAEDLVGDVAVEAAPVLAQGGVVLLHVPVPAVHGVKQWQYGVMLHRRPVSPSCNFAMGFAVSCRSKSFPTNLPFKISKKNI